jgi:hypothetical protein
MNRFSKFSLQNRDFGGKDWLGGWEVWELGCRETRKSGCFGKLRCTALYIGHPTSDIELPTLDLPFSIHG